MDCKIVMFKVEKQVIFNPLKAEISSLSSFQKICLYFFNCRFLSYGKETKLRIYEKITSGHSLVITFQIEYEVERGVK